MVVSQGIAILTETWPAEERGKVPGISNAFLTLGVVAGPVLGGLLLGYLSWQWISYVNTPIAIGGFLVCLRFLPPLVQPRGDRRFDIPGALWTALGLAANCLLLAQSQNQSLPAAGLAVLGVIALASLALFLHRGRTCTGPKVDLNIFRIRPFRRGLVIQVAVFIALLLPFYLVQLRGSRLAQAGRGRSPGYDPCSPCYRDPVRPDRYLASDSVGPSLYRSRIFHYQFSGPGYSTLGLCTSAVTAGNELLAVLSRQ